MRSSKLMTSAIVLCMIVYTVAIPDGNQPIESSTERKVQGLKIGKRLVHQLDSIVHGCTGRSGWDYFWYGCYCGLGGRGTPVDDVDRCCMIHDQCYASTSCTMSHTAYYSYDCDGCQCSCNNLVGSCEHEVCRCDVEFGQCLTRATYNPDNWSFWFIFLC